MATLRVKQHTLSRAIRMVAQSGLVVAIALLSTDQNPSLAQFTPEEEIPEVDSDIDDRIDSDIDDRIDSDIDDRIDSDIDDRIDSDIDDRIDSDDPDADLGNPSNPDISSSTRFFCQFTSSQYTVMYNPESRPNEAYPWAIPAALGGGWSPELRCQEIARRLEEYRPDGLLELQTGSENGYNTVCATSENDPSCRIVFTVPSGQDPTDTRNAVFENLTIANSGETTQGVNTFAGTGGNGALGQIIDAGRSIFGKQQQAVSSPQLRSDIQLKPYLDAADGGTGQALKKGVPITKQENRGQNKSKGLKLQPDQFR